MRHAFVDLGANVGAISLDFARNNPNHDIYCVEANEGLIGQINQKAFEARRTFVTMWSAAWIYDGVVDLFQSTAHAAATIVPGKVEHDPWPQIDYRSPTAIPCFDFSRWLLRTFRVEDDVTLKMDVEGAEYEILEKMFADRSILLVRKLICEWHYDRYPGISSERHHTVRSRAAAMTKLSDWM
jgi:FkbM family methyltransferase